MELSNTDLLTLQNTLVAIMAQCGQKVLIVPDTVSSVDKRKARAKQKNERINEAAIRAIYKTLGASPLQAIGITI